MDASRFLDRIKSASWYEDQIVHVEDIPSQIGPTAEPHVPLHPTLQNALAKNGLWPLYTHQAEALDALRDGCNVVVATPAASGKSLCYNVAVLDSLLVDRSARAIYIYPTKALAQDQLKALRELGKGLPLQAEIFDGDTPHAVRPSVKRTGQVVLTNPDMLHLGILPNHKTWSRLLRGLRYVVVDEAHLYRGVFGSHVANVLRRLRRICRLYGASPQFVLCSATISNPGELAQNLTGLPFTVIAEGGAPRGAKRFVFWNPPIVDEAKSKRKSANTEASTLFSELVSQRIRTITFVRTRRVAELVYIYAKGLLEAKAPHMANRISPYRASYLPEDRRRIEQALFNGELMGVATTNALELGIDVGTLDATVITGYPGSISSTWQQAGRSGRRMEQSLSILVGKDNPLDQYLMNHPEAFFGKPVENALISTENRHIMDPQLLCAAYEAPLTTEDGSIFGPSFFPRLEALESRGLLRRAAGKWHITAALTYPAEMVNIRSTSPHSYLVVEQGTGALLESVEESSALFQLHPGAIYLHQGEPYLVETLDLESRTAYVSPSDAPYYTQTRDFTDIKVRSILMSRTIGEVEVFLGEVEVTTQVVGFKMKKPVTEEVIGEDVLDLPIQRFDTVAFWFDIPKWLLDRTRRSRLDLTGGLHAAEHAAIGVLPLFALCDRNDIGGVSTSLHLDTGKPQVFIYDGHPGGIGIAEMGYQVIEELWETTLRAVAECPCMSGCPSCIQSPKCGNNNHPLDKQVAVDILGALCAES